jgi:hypothetical protein
VLTGVGSKELVGRGGWRCSRPSLSSCAPGGCASEFLFSLGCLFLTFAFFAHLDFVSLAERLELVSRVFLLMLWSLVSDKATRNATKAWGGRG